ncbi:hypothetical protein N0B51_12925 [Tsuneonella sp. YG55]|uniref:Uncharacterized protein n=1 Tax=Tsuneonella litorea TaxID=2976475 RepID=A0A9X2W2P9_9SPHN|nr:hypothetical protein [Tsuneonella litorea]MCT2559880.1 hypothetical protein [Tsuneonella litorea]
MGAFVRHDTKADLGNGFEPYRIVCDLQQRLAQQGDDAVDRIVTDDPPYPRERDEIVPRQDQARFLPERHENLHDPRFKYNPAIAIDDRANWRIDVDRSDVEWWHARKVGRTNKSGNAGPHFHRHNLARRAVFEGEAGKLPTDRLTNKQNLGLLRIAGYPSNHLICMWPDLRDQIAELKRRVWAIRNASNSAAIGRA